MQQVVGVVCEVEFSAMAEPRQEFATDLNVPGRNERWLLRDNLADAVMAETAQYETPEPMVSIAEEKLPPLQKPQGWGTQLQRPNFKGPTSKVHNFKEQLQGRNFNGEENRSCPNASGSSGIVIPAWRHCCQEGVNRVYNASNLF
jgi:hypothetical protein